MVESLIAFGIQNNVSVFFFLFCSVLVGQLVVPFEEAKKPSAYLQTTLFQQTESNDFGNVSYDANLFSQPKCSIHKLFKASRQKQVSYQVLVQHCFKFKDAFRTKNVKSLVKKDPYIPEGKKLFVFPSLAFSILFLLQYQ